MESTFERLKDLIIKLSGVSAEEVQKDSRLEADLGIYGDDAVDLIVAYSKKFNVDVSQFDGRKYIAPEGDSILPTIIRLITGKSKAQTDDLTVTDLEQGIVAGKLDESVIKR